MEQATDRIIIFDTTLRDGEQAPGCSMTLDEKVMVARQLEKLRVDVIEAGFPIASPGDFESVRQVSRTVTEPVVAGLARCVDDDIDRAAEALEEADKPRIHVFLATSKIHREHKLRMSREDIVQRAVAGVERALGYLEDVEFSPEDAARTEPEFLCEVVEAVIDAGATTVNIPDTVGYAVPHQFAALIRMLTEQVPNIGRAVISVHCHDDLGMAAANSLAAVRAGARQIECTVNGLGERAGNCALEEVVMALRTREDYYGASSVVDTREIINASRLVASVTGVHVPPNKAIVGRNAFAHEAGIHQDGILKKKATYEIMRPEEIGLEQGRLVLGKHSGRHAFSQRLRELGVRLDEEHLQHAFEEFKRLADKKKDIYEEDLEALVREQMEEVPQVFQLVSFHVTSGISVTPTATVAVEVADEGTRTDAAIGDGPIDAVYRAIDRITGFRCELRDFGIRAITKGKDAMGEVSLEVTSNGFTEHGRAARTDIIEASALAYLVAVNKLHKRMQSGEEPEEKPHGM
ncbi:MAG: 2-isopropylmalate synthase [Candidatus Brocadiia bacterium]